MKNSLLSISELAYYSRVSRDTLLYYDKIGLVKPVKRTSNNYRYYTGDQVPIANLIRAYQSFGYSLNDIRKLIEERTPQSFLDAYQKSSAVLNEKIEALTRTRNVLDSLYEMVKEASDVDETAISCEPQPARSIFLGPENDYSKGQSDWDALIAFYKYCRKIDPLINLNWSAWGLFDGQRIAQGDWRYPNRFYFDRPNSPDEKPAGYYVTGYARGNYGHTDELYNRILAYIDNHNLQIIGNCYEAYVLNEITISDSSNYLIRASIQVAKPDN